MSIDFIEEQDCNHSDINAPNFHEVFHGLLSREVAVKILEADGRDNVYLVRKRLNPEESNGSTEYILSFLSGGEEYHFIMTQDSSHFIFANRNYPYFKCLISHYMQVNITENSCLQHGVICKDILALKNVLASKNCYLAENLSKDKLIVLFQNAGPGSYLFREREGDSTQYSLMLFDDVRIHKIRMEIKTLLIASDSNNNDNNKDSQKLIQPLVRLVLGENIFETWEEVVDHFSNTPIVRLVVDGATANKLITPIHVNVPEDIIEGDIYRQHKFSNVDNQDKSISIHGSIQFYEGCKRKWRDGYGYINKKVLHIKKTPEITISLPDYSFIPIHYSVFNKYCFMLYGKEKQYYIAMVKPQATPNFEHLPEATYSYSKFQIDLDKNIFYSTELESSAFDELTCRSYDRWVSEVKRHCTNTKDDMANEYNPERHCKLHRYCRRAKILIKHNAGPEYNLTEFDTGPSSAIVSVSSSINATYGKVATNGQFEVMYKSIMLAIIPKKNDPNTQIRILQDLPYDVNDISILFRKVVRKKEYIIKLDQYKKVHQDIVPESDKLSLETLSPSSNKNSPLSKQSNSHQQCVTPNAPGLSASLSAPYSALDPPSINALEISADPVSTSSVFDQDSTVSCSASIAYTELIILPVNYYRTFSKHIMDNMNEIFTNNFFMTCLANAVQQEEYKKLYDYFLHMSVYWKKQIEFVFIIVKHGIDETAKSPENLFRNNSNSNRLLITYMKLFSNDWMLRSLSKLFSEIYNTELLSKNTTNSNLTIPTDNNNSGATSGNVALNNAPISNVTPSLAIGGVATNENSGIMGHADGGLVNIEHSNPDLFKSCLEATLDGITGNISFCPATLRQIFYLIQQELKSRYPESFTQQYDPVAMANTSDRNLAIQYIIITNVVILRFFNPVLCSDAKIEELFRNIAKFLKYNPANYPKDLQLDIISPLMKEISKRIQSCFSVFKISNENEAVKKSIEIYKTKYLNAFNLNLHTMMSQQDIDSRLEEEFSTVFANSLSRSFNDIFEFMVQLKSEPMFFYDSASNILRQHATAITPTNQQQLGPDKLPHKARAEYDKLFNDNFLNAIEIINKKKSGS